MELAISRQQKKLGVDKSTVSRIRQKWLASGSLTKKTYTKDRTYRKLTTPAQLLVLHLVIERPGVLLHELKKELLEVLMLEINVSTLRRFLHISGFTRQRLCCIVLQRDDFLRQKFNLGVSVYDTDMFVFLDETGADQRNILRKYGYSMRGKPPQKHTLLVRGEHVSGIGIISINGLSPL